MSRQAEPQPKFATLRAIPAGVWTLGLVSLLMDLSSEMIHALLPLYLGDRLDDPDLLRRTERPVRET